MKTKALLVAALVALTFGTACNQIELPDNWKEQNAANLAFMQEAGTIDPAQNWNVAIDGTKLQGITITSFDTPGVIVGGNNGKTSVDENVPKTPAEFFRAEQKNFKLKIEQVKSEMARLVVGVYYYNADNEIVEKTIWDIVPKNYSDGQKDIGVELNGGYYFGFFIEATSQAGQTSKFYSESSLNADGIGHAKFVAKGEYIQQTSNHAYVFLEDTAGETDCTNFIIKFAQGGASILDMDMGPWMLFCEDLGSDADNDFNDVVMKVSRKSPTQIDVEFLAAGATLPDYVYFGETLLGEIHDIFGVDDTKQMINTIKDEVAHPHKVLTVDSKFTMSSKNMSGFKVVRGTEEGPVSEVFYDQVGSAPFIICVPDGTPWAKEMKSIFAAFPKFKAWAQDRTVNTDWYLSPVAELVIGE